MRNILASLVRHLKRCGGEHFFHDWIYKEDVKVMSPKAGPYDPRSDSNRSEWKQEYICARCGATNLG